MALVYYLNLRLIQKVVLNNVAIIRIFVIHAVHYQFLLAAIALPAYQDYTVRAKIQEGVSMSSPLRTQLGILCSEGALSASVTNNTPANAALMGVEDDGSYVGKYTNGVLVDNGSATTADVTITYVAIGTQVPAAAAVNYAGTCNAVGMSWAVSEEANMPVKYLPKK